MLHKALPRDVLSFRLLELLPSKHQADIVECHLRTHALDTNKVYTALSYRWEPRSDLESILINGTLTSVGRNLAVALRHIRAVAFEASSLLSPLVWADAICINQDDKGEKSHQVQLMGAIYSKASEVVAWLGTDPDSEMALAIEAMVSIQHVATSVPDWLEDLHWIRDYPSFLEVDNSLSGIPNRTWTSLKLFLSLPYWSRVWILQEMALARNLWIMVGQHILNYEDLKWTIQLVRHFSSGSMPGKGDLPFELLYFLWCYEMIPTEVHATVNDFRKFPEMLERMKDTDKLEAIFSTREFRATDPVDKIFALQGLLGDFIVPDYERSALQVYSGLLSRWIVATGDLFFLRWAGAALQLPDTQGLGLSSWIPNFYEISLADTWQSFPSTAFHSNRGFDRLCLSQPQVLKEHLLRVNACIVDTVTALQPMLGEESSNLVRLYRYFMERKTSIEYLCKVPYLQAILRTLLADNKSVSPGLILESDPLWIQSLLLATVYFVDGLRATPPILDTLRSSIEELEIANKDHVVSFLRNLLPDMRINNCWESEKEVAACIIRHTTFLTQYLWRCLKERQHLFCTSKGYLGSCRDEIRAGDIIGVLQGCPYPVILRRKGAEYTHLGTCFVLGLMDGEAALQVEQGHLDIQEVDMK